MPEDVFKRLQEAYLNTGLNRDEFEKKTGISKIAQESLFYRHHQPRTTTLMKFLVALNLSADWVLFGIGKKELKGVKR